MTNIEQQETETQERPKSNYFFKMVFAALLAVVIIGATIAATGVFDQQPEVRYVMPGYQLDNETKAAVHEIVCNASDKKSDFCKDVRGD